MRPVSENIFTSKLSTCKDFLPPPLFSSFYNLLFKVSSEILLAAAIDLEYVKCTQEVIIVSWRLSALFRFGRYLCILSLIIYTQYSHNFTPLSLYSFVEVIPK